MDAVRMPYWLNEPDRAAISAAIDVALSTGDLYPVLDCRLRDVRTELRVATARDHVWPDKAALVRQAIGYSPDVLPIRMSEEEVTALLTLADLAPSARTALNEGKSVP